LKKVYFNLHFMNHSKWNRNEYNNFRVEYFVNQNSDTLNQQKNYQIMPESEIEWDVESNTQIWIKFYYLLPGADSKST
jgi:hypothetical protein